MTETNRQTDADTESLPWKSLRLHLVLYRDIHTYETGGCYNPTEQQTDRQHQDRQTSRQTDIKTDRHQDRQTTILLSKQCSPTAYYATVKSALYVYHSCFRPGQQMARYATWPACAGQVGSSSEAPKRAVLPVPPHFPVRVSVCVCVFICVYMCM